MNTYGALVEIMTEGNQSITTKICPGATVPTTKPTWTDTGLQKQRHMIKPRRRGKASVILISHTKGSYQVRRSHTNHIQLQTTITTVYTYNTKNSGDLSCLLGIQLGVFCTELTLQILRLNEEK